MEYLKPIFTVRMGNGKKSTEKCFWCKSLLTETTRRLNNNPCCQSCFNKTREEREALLGKTNP